MIWIVLVLVVLCIAMLCVALWYRGKLRKAKESYGNMTDLYYEMKEKYNDDRDERERLSNIISALNIEVDATKEKLQKSEDMSQRRLKAYYECRKDRDRFQEELRQLRESLPKRDSKGRFCKK